MTINILAVNVNSPAKERGRQQLKALLGSGADILILTEVKKSAAAEEIVYGLRADGFHVLGWSDGTFEDFTTLVATKVPYQMLEPLPSRVQTVIFDSTPSFSIVAGYGISSDPFGRNSDQKISAKKKWLEEFLVHVRSVAPERENLLVIGDLNFVDDRTRPQYKSLYGFERAAYTDLISLPLRDIFSESEDYTWVSHQGHGFRYDHAFSSPSLAACLEQFSFAHEWRLGEERLTDHSAIQLKFALSFSRIAHPQDSGSHQTTLF